MRGIKTPFVVELMSSNEDAFGDSVPMPAAPVVGNVFVCARSETAAAKDSKMRSEFFLIIAFLVMIFLKTIEHLIKTSQHQI